jgi:hypothetical protein
LAFSAVLPAAAKRPTLGILLYALPLAVTFFATAQMRPHIRADIKRRTHFSTGMLAG